LRARPYGRVIAALVTEAQTDPAFEAQHRAHFVAPRRRDGEAALSRAIARGEIRGGADVELALDLLYGPLYHRLLHRTPRSATASWPMSSTPCFGGFAIPHTLVVHK
jgi:hypothetical protein